MNLEWLYLSEMYWRCTSEISRSSGIKMVSTDNLQLSKWIPYAGLDSRILFNNSINVASVFVGWTFLRTFLMTFKSRTSLGQHNKCQQPKFHDRHVEETCSDRSEEETLSNIRLRISRVKSSHLLWVSCPVLLETRFVLSCRMVLLSELKYVASATIFLLQFAEKRLVVKWGKFLILIHIK